ncbi:MULTISPECIES: twin-arginine translocation signal domain-containing protein [unclassified Brucella]|uniref:twin-arginine translocation signal domain-containing protein n=1 Tax=unclassified Brucella TaxID=2632610 RepID=UPI00217DF856|nr:MULTISPECIES: twin-arginine translocation signal domain-containing protein [unclassified Brucella]UWF67446.1 twin-arginine translocation signal domain-containing protein [Brucella sp. 1315]UWF70572.1 twin-arginine translocation signal domain-containing protein [Brucella sp. 2594]
MNRRRFLSFLGLAPVAAAVPAMALPSPEKPTDIDVNPEITKPLIFKDGKLWINQANVDAPLYDLLKHGDDFDAWWNRVNPNVQAHPVHASHMAGHRRIKAPPSRSSHAR